MGPPLFSDGDKPKTVPPIAAGFASMGPPLFSDGDEPVVRFHTERSAKASMGPPLFSDGDERYCSRDWHGLRPLQWGRRSSATETLAVNKRKIDLHPASMGPPLFSDGDTNP